MGIRCLRMPSPSLCIDGVEERSPGGVGGIEVVAVRCDPGVIVPCERAERSVNPEGFARAEPVDRCDSSGELCLELEVRPVQQHVRDRMVRPAHQGHTRLVRDGHASMSACLKSSSGSALRAGSRRPERGSISSPDASCAISA